MTTPTTHTAPTTPTTHTSAPRTPACSTSTPRRAARSCLQASLLAVIAGSVALADDGQLLVTNSGSLTAMQMSAATPVQDVIPHVLDRGANLDGSARAGSAFGWRLNANTIGGGTVGGRTLNAVDLATGSPVVTAMDLSLPAKQPWAVGRSYSTRQDDGAHYDSNGYQGRNWFQMSQPELVFELAGADADDLVYLVYGADRYLEFRRVALSAGGYSSTAFRAVNGAAGVLEFDEDTGTDPDLWTYHDQGGNTAVFFGDDDDAGGSSPDAGGAVGQLWKVADPAGNTAFVGDSATISTAVSNGYDASGRILYAYDSADRRYTYTYSTIDSVKRLTEVKAETKTGGTWASPTGVAEVGKVGYGYYQTGDNTYGDNGCLELVTVTTPLSDSGVSLVEKTYYRYWVGAFNATTNPGHAYALQYIIDAEGYRQADWADADLSDNDPQSMSETILKPYASAYFEYEDRTTGQGRVDKSWFNGECGCSGGINGTYEFTYGIQTSGTWTSAYETAWKYRAVISRPDGTYETRYFDEVGQPLSSVITDGDPATGTPDTWVTKVVRDSLGCVTHVYTPANATGYTHDTGGNPDGSITSSTSVGLIQIYNRPTTGDLAGLIDNNKWQEGTSGTVYYTRTTEFGAASETIGNATLKRPQVSRSWPYTSLSSTPSSPLTGEALAVTVTGSGSAPLVAATIERAQPKVATSQNGSGSVDSATASEHNTDGTVSFSKSATGIIGYRTYNSFGRVEKSVTDADTTKSGAGEIFNGVTIPSTPVSFASAGTPHHDLTSYTYDAQGRADETTAPDGDVSKRYYTKLADGRMVTVSIPLVTNPGSVTYHGPVSYTVTNLAGKVECSGTIALSTTTTALTSWIDETKDDPIEALGVGALSRISVTVYNTTGGSVTETRSYFDLPGTPNYLPGTEGTHYDASFLGYDDMGRRWRSKDATGTIQRTVFDDLGRATESWVGTNDSSFTGGEASGTDNMVKVSATEFDSGNDGGNSLVTKTTSDPDGNWGTTTDQRVTEYLHDSRGRVVVTKGSQAPYGVVKYDEQGQVTASASYSSSSGLDAGDDPTTLATNRVSLGKTLYDVLGRSYETRSYKINQSTGAIEQESSSDVYVRSQTWYDPEGREMKTEGSTIAKTRYDRLGRATHRWTIASDDDTSYGGAASSTAVWDSTTLRTNITGDLVVVEHQTTYEADTGRTIMTATIERDFADRDGGETTGALDTNADADDLLYTAANLKGRIQISASWYDSLGRPVDTVQYGTYGGSDFDRDGLSAPARSDTALRTTVSYNTDGTRQQVEDPAGTKTRWTYDDAGRVVATISNYVDGTPSGATGADDNYVRQVYTDGLQTKLWVDLDGDNTEDADDQVTTYAYGVTTADSPGASKINSGRLLRTVTYPDSGGASDTVRYAYDAIAKWTWKRDQAGNEFARDFDAAGRITHKRITSLAGGFNADVLRITTAYTTRGQVDTVTQYDNATVGSGNIVDQVQYINDQWGNVTTFDQDWNSAISGDSVDVDYSFALAQTEGTGIYRQLRGTGMTLPNGASVSYAYRSTSGYHDDELGRVTSVQVASTYVATYEYNGLATLVGTEYPEADLLYTRYNTGGTFDRIDNFNRVTDDIWTRGIDTDSNGSYDIYRDFYDTDISWSRSSNIDLVKDNVYPNLDVAYTNDGLERLTQAKRGTWGGSSITSPVHDEQWTLSQTGNWDVYKLDLNGDTDFIDANELNDDRTFNTVNELTARDTDDNGTDDYTLTHDAVGNLTNDGQDYEYIYDAWGRLVEVQNQSQQTVAEYSYNGLGYRTGWHYDVDGDGTVEANTVSNTEDPWYQFVYDRRWRLLATYRSSHHNTWTIDNSPKEQFIHHRAGLHGIASSTTIESMVLRDRDANTAWESQADGTLEERSYCCQNWRADVIAMMTDAGQLINSVRYDPYGVPFGIPKTDMDGDGDADTDDYSLYYSYYTGDTMPFADWNWDGTKNSTDILAYGNDRSADSTLGRGTLGYGYSHASGANRKGYAGYEIEPILSGSAGWRAIYDLAYRWYDASRGTFGRRDPLHAISKGSTYRYVTSQPMTRTDPSGLNDIIIKPSGGPKVAKSGADYRLDFIYTLERPLTCEKDSDGWVVQKIAFGGKAYDCDSGDVVRDLGVDIGTYWEAWKVPHGSQYLSVPTGKRKVWRPTRGDEVTDSLRAPMGDGNYSANGEGSGGVARLYCANDIADQDPPESEPKWVLPPPQNTDGTPGQPEHPWGYLPGTKEEPGFWRDPSDCRADIPGLACRGNTHYFRFCEAHDDPHWGAIIHFMWMDHSQAQYRTIHHPPDRDIAGDDDWGDGHDEIGDPVPVPPPGG